ncbi:conserved Plasmodium protein, unknown function [Plasmodium relictum]|uniref:Merozoite surface protein 10 n=1 Tax=Plasmodium relictum TaxID=85471 RepID=A0A1J1H3V0_PLARL|nr:conserved Plasmodium protein, unknown function [Plasmodium relictum]CRG99575.1 conserved Plasmodium protein, unknown function [Plasmodium relictum]
MPPIILWILTFFFFFKLLLCSLIASNLTEPEDTDFKIIYESHSRHLIITSKNQETCNSTYYINEQCKIIDSHIEISKNNTELCLNKNKCSYIEKYIFETVGIGIASEEDFSKELPCNNENDKTKHECNKELYINENIKCMCCKKDTPYITTDEAYKNAHTKCLNYNQYTFSECKCLLKYDTNDDNITTNKCENFTCRGGLCTLKVNGEPFCSCFDNYYFDKNKNECKRHEEIRHNTQFNENEITPSKVYNTSMPSTDGFLFNNNKKNPPGFFFLDDDKSILIIKRKKEEKESDSLHTEEEKETGSLHTEEEKETGSLHTEEEKETDSLHTEEKKDKNETSEKIDNIEESVCLRIECFSDLKKPKCFCLNRKGEKIGHNIFDVSNINICTLNNIICDNGKCNNSSKKDYLGCICDQNYIYDKDLKVCISFSLRTFLNFILAIIIYIVMLIIN